MNAEWSIAFITSMDVRREESGFTRKFAARGANAPASFRRHKTPGWWRRWSLKAVATATWWTLILRKSCFRRSPKTPSSFWTTPVSTNLPPLKNGSRLPAANCSFCRRIRPTSTPSNTSGQPSNPPFAASFPTQKTQPFLLPICVNVIVVSYSTFSR